ncbi:hypothetical protein V6Z12_D05G133000 [Gossypium hirsutum]
MVGTEQTKNQGGKQKRKIEDHMLFFSCCLFHKQIEGILLYCMATAHKHRFSLYCKSLLRGWMMECWRSVLLGFSLLLKRSFAFVLAFLFKDALPFAPF